MSLHCNYNNSNLNVKFKEKQNNTENSLSWGNVSSRFNDNCVKNIALDKRIYDVNVMRMRMRMRQTHKEKTLIATFFRLVLNLENIYLVYIKM